MGHWAERIALQIQPPASLPHSPSPLFPFSVSPRLPFCPAPLLGAPRSLLPAHGRVRAKQDVPSPNSTRENENGYRLDAKTSSKSHRYQTVWLSSLGYAQSKNRPYMSLWFRCWKPQSARRPGSLVNEMAFPLGFGAVIRRRVGVACQKSTDLAACAERLEASFVPRTAWEVIRAEGPARRPAKGVALEHRPHAT